MVVKNGNNKLIEQQVNRGPLGQDFLCADHFSVEEEWTGDLMTALLGLVYK